MRGSGAVECEKVHGTGKGLVWRWQACVLQENERAKRVSFRLANSISQV